MHVMIAPVIKYGAAAIFTAVGVSGSVKLIVTESPSPWALFALSAISFCCLLIMFFEGSIEWFDLKNLRVNLKKIDDTKKEVKEREKRVKRLSLLVADLGETLEKNALIMAGADDEAFKKLIEEIRNI